jgi:protein TonB
MYRNDLNTGDRAGTIAVVALVHVMLAYAFLNISGTMRMIEQEIIPQLIDVDVEPPPPPIVEVALEKEKPKEKEGTASPKNIKSVATPVAAPKPRIQLPVPPPVPVTETPHTGSESTQGAAPVPGPGTGAGGVGTGTGAGGSGSGTGGGGEGIAAVRTRLATNTLRGRDFPRQLLAAWPRGAWVRMRFRVDANGAIQQCIVDQGTGNPGIDSQVCAIARQRLRYQPALNRNGQRVADWAGYGQEPPR